MSSSLQALITSPSCQNRGRQLQDLVKMHVLNWRQPIHIVSDCVEIERTWRSY